MKVLRDTISRGAHIVSHNARGLKDDFRGHCRRQGAEIKNALPGIHSSWHSRFGQNRLSALLCARCAKLDSQIELAELFHEVRIEGRQIMLVMLVMKR